MGEINLTPFEEEEAFTQAGLSNRFAEVGQQGIDDLTKVAFQDGCLNENHSPSFLSFSQTVEFPSDALVATQVAVLGVAYEASWDAGTSLQTGLAYWNRMTSSSTKIMDYPPNDGVWGVIEDGAGNDLKCTLPAAVTLSDPQFNDRFGLNALLVMMNVQVERVELYETDGVTPLSTTNTFSEKMGAAFAIQVSNDNVSWYHLYLGDSVYVNGAATGNAPYRYRVTERRVEFWRSEGFTTPETGLSRNFPCRRDVSIRTIINASSLANTVNANNVKPALTSFRYIRGVISIIKPGGGDGDPSGGAYDTYDKLVRVRLRKANLTVLALRANEVDPNA